MLRHNSTSSSTTLNSISTASGSSSESLQGSEPPLTRRERLNSTVSVAGSQHCSAASNPISIHNSYDEPDSSTRTLQCDSESSTKLYHQHSRQPSSMRRADSMHQHLPSLSDMLDTQQNGMNHPTVVNVISIPTSRPASTSIVPAGRISSLRPEPSSNSISVSRSFGRSPWEGPLPIHALLSDSTISGSLGPAAGTAKKPTLGYTQGPRGYGTYLPDSTNKPET